MCPCCPDTVGLADSSREVLHGLLAQNTDGSGVDATAPTGPAVPANACPDAITPSRNEETSS